MGSDVVTYNIIEEQILELYTKGLNRQDIALQLDIPVKVVNRVFNKPNVKEKIAEIVETRELLLKEKHTAILDELTDKMLEKAREEGDLTDLLNKNRDILDVIYATDKLNKELEKKRLGTSDQNVMINILNQLAGDSDE